MPDFSQNHSMNLWVRTACFQENLRNSRLSSPHLMWRCLSNVIHYADIDLYFSCLLVHFFTLPPNFEFKSPSDMKWHDIWYETFDFWLTLSIEEFVLEGKNFVKGNYQISNPERVNITSFRENWKSVNFQLRIDF